MAYLRAAGYVSITVLACLVGPTLYFGLCAAFGPPPPDPFNKACTDAGYRVWRVHMGRLCITPDGLVAMSK